MYDAFILLKLHEFYKEMVNRHVELIPCADIS
jgi:hypothetical protein